jgi:hypothetical protein
VFDADHPLYRRWPRGDVGLLPGRYSVQASFESKVPSAYPAPLFWTVADQSATAETELVIGEPVAAISASAQAWLDNVLRQAGGTFQEPVDCRDPELALDCDAMQGYGQSIEGGYVDLTKALYSADILPFVDNGYSAIPELMKHVRDDRSSG